MLLNRALALASNLRKRNIQICSNCCLCNKYEETEDHLFRDCQVASYIWGYVPFGIRVHIDSIIPINDLMKLFWKINGNYITRIRYFVATIWAIWLHRNNVIFRSVDISPFSIMSNMNLRGGKKKRIQIVKFYHMHFHSPCL